MKTKISNEEAMAPRDGATDTQPNTQPAEGPSEQAAQDSSALLHDLGPSREPGPLPAVASVPSVPFVPSAQAHPARPENQASARAAEASAHTPARETRPAALHHEFHLPHADDLHAAGERLHSALERHGQMT